MHIPTRHGVGPTGVFLPAGPWPAVLDFLVERMPHISRDAWNARLRSQSVLNAEGQPVLLAQPYTPHTRVFYYRHIEDEPQLPEPQLPASRGFSESTEKPYSVMSMLMAPVEASRLFSATRL